MFAVLRGTRLLLLISSCAFALALMLTITIHELGHAFAALALGFPPTVHPSSVEYGTAPTSAQVVIALADRL